MKLFVLVLSLLFIQISQAQVIDTQTESALIGIQGQWLGFGTWKFKGEGPGSHCSYMKMTWTETANQLTMGNGLFDCEYVRMHLTTLSWKKVGQDLFDSQNVKVGQFKQNELSIQLPNANPNTQVIVHLKKENNHYDYQEVWFNKYEKVYVIDGRLFNGQSSIENTNEK